MMNEVPVARWQVLLGLLAAETSSGAYAYPDQDTVLERGAFADQKQAEEQALRDGLWTKAVGEVPPAQIIALDVGCGEGRYTAWLQAQCGRLLSIDPDPIRLARARRAALALPHQEAVFAVASVLSPLWRAPDVCEVFTVVHCLQVLGHLVCDDAGPAMETFARLLAPGGGLILAVPFHTRPWDVCMLTSQNERGQIETTQVPHATYDAAVTAPAPGVLPVRHFCAESLVPLLERAGLAVCEMHPYHWRSDHLADLMLRAQRRP